ncbi:hypothetical protein Pan44_19500 [Caulifigura coniformis]|uniref:Uncharacterized protein n=1 Tax=Caulifigura coniformis TaxID=2527983 RepID=A0A517SCS3_9PLAN|nr:cation transporter [Caulifigura coniformis]QDT53924.1 hypothetical protein Pan44_19500 [Caulifigura coniformis]
MKTFQVMVMSMTLCAVCGFDAISTAGEPQPTIVTVKKLCPTCGKKIVQKLSQMPQVAEATMSVEERTLRVRCAPGGSVSPRAVWEAVESGGEQPVKIQCPAGTFTSKPRE